MDITMARQAPGKRNQYPTFYELPTRWLDNDQYGHMNNVIHYVLFDTAVTNWQLDSNVFDSSGALTRFLVVESGCRYFSEAGYPDMIHAGIRVGKVGNSSWKYEIGLFRNTEEKTFAEGFFSQVQVDALSGKPKQLSKELRLALNTLKIAN